MSARTIDANLSPPREKRISVWSFQKSAISVKSSKAMDISICKTVFKCYILFVIQIIGLSVFFLMITTYLNLKLLLKQNSWVSLLCMLIYAILFIIRLVWKDVVVLNVILVCVMSTLGTWTIGVIASTFSLTTVSCAFVVAVISITIMSFIAITYRYVIPQKLVIGIVIAALALISGIVTMVVLHLAVTIALILFSSLTAFLLYVLFGYDLLYQLACLNDDYISIDMELYTIFLIALYFSFLTSHEGFKKYY
ncbi:uncharacterized protein LOC106669013 [Cimex lectularius]|uniref:Uncharacterized protein n=1 Tax=Cimex lectularius TaxID=79782 RepID=A0A8I6S184_CIMLE|nr:uncharacterized protein LOC106669013 [Cimex lectularius]